METVLNLQTMTCHSKNYCGVYEVKTVIVDSYDRETLKIDEIYIVEENETVIFAHDCSFVFSLKEVGKVENGQVYSEYKGKLYNKLYHGLYEKGTDYNAMYENFYGSKTIVVDNYLEEQLALF